MNVQHRISDLTSAIRIEVLTIAWMIVEAGLSVTAGIRACSTSLIAFGADSIIELLTAGILLWRLRLERREGRSLPVQNAENKAAWITGYALIALSIYVLVEGLYGIFSRTAVESSPVGIGVTIVAVIFMPFLGFKKRRLATALDSAALRADAACSLTCGYMAAAVLLGLAAKALTGLDWIDGVVSLGLLYWLIPEAKEAIEGAKAGKGACACE